jgi:hypothetical protein
VASSARVLPPRSRSPNARRYGASRLLWRATVWLLYAPALLVLALYLAAFLSHAWSVVSFPFEIDYGEVPELNRALLLAQGRSIYVDWSLPPYQMANYTPLYPLATSLGVRAWGVQFFTGRLLSLASTLATGACIAATTWALRGGLLGALIAGLLYFVPYPVWNWGAYQRVDAFAVFWEWLGIAIFAMGWIRGRRKGTVWATVPLFLVAAYSRQTVAAGAFACYGALLFRRPRLALGAIAAYAAGGLLIFGALDALTGGQFWRHIVFGNLNRWSWDTVDDFWEPFWRLMHWAFPLAAAGALFAAVRRQSQVPLLYLIASAATALTIGKIGSSFNYLLQLCAALALLGGLAVGQAAWLGGAAVRALAGRFAERLPKAIAIVCILPIALLASAGIGAPSLWLLAGLQQAYHVPYAVEGSSANLRAPAPLLDRLGVTRRRLWRIDPWAAPPADLTHYWRNQYRGDPTDASATAAQRARDYIARLEGDVLSEDMSFTLTANKRIYVQPFEFTQLAEQGVWDQRPLVEAIRRRHFVAVVLRFRLGDAPGFHAERIDAPLIAALKEAYRLDASYGTYFIYRPAGQ